MQLDTCLSFQLTMKRRPFSRVPLPSPGSKSKKLTNETSGSCSNASPECAGQVEVLKDTNDLRSKTENTDKETKLQHKGDGDRAMSPKIPVFSNVTPIKNASNVEPAVDKSTVSESCDPTENKPVNSCMLPLDYSLRSRSSDPEPSECSRDSFMDSEHSVGTSATQIKGGTL